MPLTTAQWIEELKAYPPDTIVRFIDGTICFEAPDGSHIPPRDTEALAEALAEAERDDAEDELWNLTKREW